MSGKITALAALAAPLADDLVPVVDVHDTAMASSGTTKRVTVGALSPAVVTVPKPTGATATDTPAVTAAISSLVTALAAGPATLQFADGTYQVDSNSAVIRSVANFAVRGTGATVIAQAPNTAAKPDNTTGDLMVIADCTDFRVEGITFDGLRDTVAPLTPLTASAASGQPSVTVAAGNGARYQAGQFLSLFGGLGTAESNQSDGFSPGHSTPLIVQSITAGGGAGGGDLITFTVNLANSYAQVSSTVFSDGFGPYAYAGAYLTPYQTANGNSVAGRTLSGEDQQNGLHLLNCQRFAITRVTARNLWESPIKLGAGFEPSNGSLNDGCQQGVITDCAGYHAYDQGVSVWLSRNITVKGCVLNAAGWAGVSLTGSDDCVVAGNQVLNSYYRVPNDNGSGSGICCEGGLHNQVKGNIIKGVYSDGVRMTPSPLGFGAFGTSAKTTSAYLAAGTAAGTSVALSSTTGLNAAAPYSLVDGSRTEAVTVATIVDGTHVTFNEALAFSHPAGIYLGQRIAQENVIEGNTVTGPQTGQGIKAQTCARPVIKNNVIRGIGSSGIVLTAATWGPAGNYLGGDGAHIEGNTVIGVTGQCITADSAGGYLIRGNRLSGATTNALMYLQGVFDSVIEGNHLADMEFAAGIRVQNGSVQPSVHAARLAIKGNVVKRTSNEGILLLAGDSIAITGNIAVSCGGNAGINLRGVTNSLVAGNVCNSNKTSGIQLEDNGASFCLNNKVTGNTCRDDGSGANVTTGAGWTQQHGIRETGTSNENLFTGNECDANAVDQLATVGAASYAWNNIISGAVTAGTSPSGVASVTAADTSIVIGGTASAPTVATGTLDVIAADHPPAANWSNNSKKITSLANGTAAADAAAFGQVLSLQATTGAAGFALQNATPDIVTWTTPNDGAMHRVMLLVNMNVTVALTGGQVIAHFTDPGGGAGSPQMIAANSGTGDKNGTAITVCVGAATTVRISQNSAVTAGTATAYAEIWGL